MAQGVVKKVTTTSSGNHFVTVRVPGPPEEDIDYALPTDKMLDMASDAFGQTITIEPSTGTQPRTATSVSRP